MSSTPAEGDGLDELQAQIKAHEPMSREAKLEAARQELLQEEAYCLIQYDAAKKIGESLTPHDLVMSSRPLVLLLWRGHCVRRCMRAWPRAPRAACPVTRCADATSCLLALLPPAGDRQEMDLAAESWKLCAGQLALLRQHPDKFVRRYGAFYDLK